MTQEEKANAYDKLHEKIALRFGSNVAEEIFSEFEMSEDEKIRKAVIEEFQVMAIGGCEDKCFRNGVKIKEALAWLEKQGEQKSAEWYKEDEQNLNACLSYIPDEFLRRWLTDAIHVKYDKPVMKIEDEEYDGEDYGIDSLWHAHRILEKTLGEVDGYQTDDGILSHKCAITAVKKLYEQKPAEWNEEDEKMVGNIRSMIEKYAISQSAVDVNGELCDKTYIDADNWLKFLKQRYTWKPSKEQMKLLKELVEDNNQRHFYALLKSLYVQLKTLKGE